MKYYLFLTSILFSNCYFSQNIKVDIEQILLNTDNSGFYFEPEELYNKHLKKLGFSYESTRIDSNFTVNIGDQTNLKNYEVIFTFKNNVSNENLYYSYSYSYVFTGQMLFPPKIYFYSNFEDCIKTKNLLLIQKFKKIKCSKDEYNFINHVYEKKYLKNECNIHVDISINALNPIDNPNIITYTYNLK